MTAPRNSPLDKPARVLGGVSATCVVIGAIIGVGIFITPAMVAQQVEREELVLVAWAIGGFIALCGAFVFAELGGMFTGDGAQYAVLRDGYGPLPAFLFVFCIATIIQPGTITVIGITCAEYLLLALNQPEPPGWWLGTIAILLIVLLTAANVIGVKAGAGIQNLTVYAKVFALLAVTLLAIVASPTASPAVESTPAEPTRSATLGIAAALVSILFTFGGWQQVMWIAGEVREPKRNLPRAILLGVAIVILMYLLVNWAFLDLLGFDALCQSPTVAADAVGTVYPTWGRRLTAAAVAVSAFGVLNANILTGPRLVYGMARDGRFFSVFARLWPRFGTPAASIVFASALALVFLVIGGRAGSDALLNAVVLVDVVFFLFTGTALFIFRKTKKEVDRPIRCLGYPVVPILFLAGEFLVLVFSFLTMTWTAVTSLAWIGAGLLTYFIWFRRRGDQLGPA